MKDCRKTNKKVFKLVCKTSVRREKKAKKGSRKTKNNFENC